MSDHQGWEDIEQSIRASELTPVPPSSDPERLLRYVLQIHPQYIEMEMLVTHLRLYTTSLEQDLAQATAHTRILGMEIDHEREKRQFLERYAAQIIKERNDVLHARPHKTKSDLTPSIATLRGEKIQELNMKIKGLQDELTHHERIRQEMNFLLKKTQREQDSKDVSDRKHIEQLEKQIIQRSMLNSNLERKLYEVEKALARQDGKKREEFEDMTRKIESFSSRIKILEDENENLSHTIDKLTSEKNHFQERWSQTLLLNDQHSAQVDSLHNKLAAASAEIESLQSEVLVLQNEDMSSLKTMYMKKISNLQEQWSKREHELLQENGILRQELRSQENRVTSAVDTIHSDGEQNNTSAASEKDMSTWSNEFKLGITTQEAIGSSLSRSQLSDSVVSISQITVSQDNISSIHSEECDESLPWSNEIDTDFWNLDDNDDECEENQDSDHMLEQVVHDVLAEDEIQDVRDSFISKSTNGSETGKHAVKEVEGPTNELLSDLRLMLRQFEQRRVKEEHKAQLTEQALLTFQEQRVIQPKSMITTTGVIL